MENLSGASPHAQLIRSQLWSPVQNTTLWMAWWLHGIISADQVISAFHSVQGKYHRLFMDVSNAHAGTSPQSDESTGLSDLLKAARSCTAGAPIGIEERPLVGLALAGMGHSAPLPQGAAAEAVNIAGAGMVFADPDPEVHHVAVPEVVDDSVVYWNWYTANGRAPQLSIHSPGDADMMLREAIDDAEHVLVDDSRANGGKRSNSHLRSPRLAVGELSDAFGLPGLPAGVAPRAEKLMARADVVSAIVEVARATPHGGSLDPYLLPLGRAIRTARMVAVDFAQRELLR